MAGGTFTISNGGVFGSLMGTPIINLPQTAVLGLHAVNQKPVAINGKVEIRPMMYLALTYDHRLLDGREAVTFLVQIKKLIEVSFPKHETHELPWLTLWFSGPKTYAAVVDGKQQADMVCVCFCMLYRLQSSVHPETLSFLSISCTTSVGRSLWRFEVFHYAPLLCLVEAGITAAHPVLSVILRNSSRLHSPFEW